MKTYSSSVDKKQKDLPVTVHFPSFRYVLTNWGVDMAFDTTDKNAFNLGSFFFTIEIINFYINFKRIVPKLKSFSGNHI